MLKKLIDNLVERTPALTVQDVYKALFQMCMGAEHAVVDEEQALLSLKQEYESITAANDTPLLQLLGRGVYRLHLRPAKFHGLVPQEVVAPFLATASEAGDKQLLIALVNQLNDISRAMGDEQAVDYCNKIAARGYPSVSHTAVYKKYYQPAYRIMSQQHIPLHWVELANTLG